ncbi:hypothetical protein [Meridianimarinicoccus roseus]|uniref:hypothetical protein n=1 Tax=Meridianimarinicoccus roseus TaxID=2072018 RepID=UPI0011B27811|nr:hypothetical protein [Meridianimarinicoccus roseus]
MTTALIEKFAILDFEASRLSPEGWPIEIGLSWLSFGDLRSWSSLIKPTPDQDLSDWSEESAAVHKIPFAEFDAEPAAAAVSEDFWRTLRGRILVSDAPEFEERWFHKLLYAAGTWRSRPSRTTTSYPAVCSRSKSSR